MNVQLTRKALPTVPTADSGMAALWAQHQRHLKDLKKASAALDRNPYDTKADDTFAQYNLDLWSVTEKIMGTPARSEQDLGIKARAARTRFELSGHIDATEEMLLKVLDDVIAYTYADRLR